MGTSASASIISTETAAVAIINGQQRATMQHHQQDHPPSPSAKGSTDGTGGDVDDNDIDVDDDDDSKENALSSALILPMTMTIAAATDANANTASSNTNTGKRRRRRDTRCNKGSAAGGAVVPPDDQTTTTTALMPSPGSSCGVRRRTAGGVAVFETDGSIGDGRNKRCKTSKEKDQEDMEWICAECKEAECGLVAVAAEEDNGDDNGNGDHDGFLFCDGPCRRIFHLPCAGLSKPPDSDGEWLCKDCGNGRHACAYCSEYGQDGVDVFPCGERSCCGLFFHEACLQARNVDYTYSSHALAANDGGSSGPPRSDGDGEDDDDDEEEETPRIPLFTCPAHHCWTCTQKDMIQIEKEEVEKEQRQREEEDDTAAQQNGGTAKKKTQKRRRSKKRDTIFKSKTEARIYVSEYV